MPERHVPAWTLTGGFAGPLILLVFGLAVGLATTSGRPPATDTLLSYVGALLLYLVAERLAAGGRAHWVALVLGIAALLLIPLAFGPSPLENRKIVAFNAWAYALGSTLPPFVYPPPNPNGVAGGIMAAMAVCGGIALGEPARRRRFFWAGLVALLGAGLLLSASRAGWLAGGAALVVLALRRSRRAAFFTLAAGSLLAMALMFGSGSSPGGIPALASTRSMAFRAGQWQDSVALLAQQPVTGLGLARFPYRFAEWVGPKGHPEFKTPNNALLQLWADAGLAGVLAGGWIVVIAASRLWGLARRRCLPWAVVGTAAALVGFLVHGIFEANTAIIWATPAAFRHLASPLPYALLGLLAGLLREPARQDAKNAKGKD